MNYETSLAMRTKDQYFACDENHTGEYGYFFQNENYPQNFKTSYSLILKLLLYAAPFHCGTIMTAIHSSFKQQSINVYFSNNSEISYIILLLMIGLGLI